MKLKAKQIIKLNAGHSLDQAGAVTTIFSELEETIKIRDLCIPLLIDAGFVVQKVPDNLRLVGSINWVNKRSTNINSGLSLAIHFNASSNSSIKGTEVYYYGQDKKSAEMASILSRNISTHAGTKNRGRRSDTVARFNRLAWIRDTKTWSLLIEVEYLSNRDAMRALDYNKVAEGIVSGLMEIYGIKPIKKNTKEIEIKVAKDIEIIKIIRI